MAFKLAELFVDIVGHAGGLNAALAKSKAGLMGLQSAAGGVAQGLAAGFGLPTAATLGLGAAGLAAGAAVAVGLTKALRVAGDLNETVSKTKEVFGDSSKSVLAAADEMAAKFGVARGTFLDAASQFGLIAEGAGKSESAAAQLSIQLAKLADDASSFYNADLPTALEKIRAGLSGESEPLRAWGVMLDEHKVKVKALALGYKVLNDEAKFAARMALIQEGLAKASGDHARTMDSFNNQVKQFWGNLENFGAEAGDVLMPLGEAILGLANGALGTLGGWLHRNKDLFKGFATGAADTIKEVVGAAARLGKALWTLLSPAAGAGIVLVLKAIGEIVGTVAHIVAGALNLISHHLEQLAGALDVLYEAVGLGGGKAIAAPLAAGAEAAGAKAPAAGKDPFDAANRPDNPSHGKGATHSLADFYAKLREGVFKKEDGTNKAIAANTQATVVALGEVKRAIQQKKPGVAVAAAP